MPQQCQQCSQSYRQHHRFDEQLSGFVEPCFVESFLRFTPFCLKRAVGATSLAGRRPAFSLNLGVRPKRGDENQRGRQG